ncbi:SGNH/GDSL hydrolase family protein [candidate division KSB1 bacterium]|nr:SGNH/GDSL hydrolase family protein [candidate division KSB1 bacterium]
MKILKKVFIFIISCLVLCVVFEMFIRFTGIGTPSLIVSDRVLGRVLRPNVSLVLLNEGFYMGRINKYGYFGPGYAPGKSKNTLRIALLGDSFVAGFHLLGRHHFRTVLEKQLSERTGKNVQVLNFGFAGFNFEKMYIYYRLLVQKFEPDITLFFIGQDDFTEIDEKIGPAVLVENQKPVIKSDFLQDVSYERTKKFEFLRQSSFYSLHKAALGLLLRGETIKIVLDKLYPGTKHPEEKQVPLTPERDAINRAILYELSEDSAGVIFVNKRPIPKSTHMMLQDFGIILLDPSVKLDSLRQHGIDPDYWPLARRSGHWNYYGHKAVGEFLAQKLEPVLREKSRH